MPISKLHFYLKFKTHLFYFHQLLLLNTTPSSKHYKELTKTYKVLLYYLPLPKQVSVLWPFKIPKTTKLQFYLRQLLLS